MERWSVEVVECWVRKKAKTIGSIVECLIFGIWRLVITLLKPITPLLHFSSTPILIEEGANEHRGL